MNERKINEFSKQFLGMCAYSSNEHFTSSELNLANAQNSLKTSILPHSLTSKDNKFQDTHQKRRIFTLTHTLCSHAIHILFTYELFCKMFKVVSKLIQNGIW